MGIYTNVKESRKGNAFGLHEEEGWVGNFTRAEAPGMFPNGTRIVKVAKEKGDAHEIGAEGTVLGSMAAGGIGGYFVEWDGGLKHAVFVGDFKVEAI